MAPSSARHQQVTMNNMPSRTTTESSNSSSFESYSASTRPVSESAVPELDPDLSTTDDVTSDYLSTRTMSILSPLMDHDDDGFGAHYDTPSIYAPSHFPTVPSHYTRGDRSWMEEETVDSTRSITDQDVNYCMENGRRYCGDYYMPNDEDEQVRLQLLHQVYFKVLDGELTTVPLECPSHILDIGTGVGEWAIEMAETYPECDVTGTDVSNIFERRVPQNVFWEVDDAEIAWERPSNFYDLIHFRDMTGAFSDWNDIYKSAFRCLKPGGWIEVLDFDDRRGFADLFSFFEPESLLFKLARDLQEASVLSGRPRGVGHVEPRLLVNAGYVDVKLTEYSIPLKTQDGSTGKFWLLSCLNGMEPLCMRLLTKFKGWAPEDVRMGCEMVGEELMTLTQDPKRARSYLVKLRVLTGRKPGRAVHWPAAPASERVIAREGLPLDASEVLQVDPEVITEEGNVPAVAPLSKEGEDEGSGRPGTVHGHIDTGITSTGNTTEDWVRNIVHPNQTAADSDGDPDTKMEETIVLNEGEGNRDTGVAVSLDEQCQSASDEHSTAATGVPGPSVIRDDVEMTADGHN